jgi:hypothetical protein
MSDALLRAVRLDDLARQINGRHEATLAGLRTALESARDAGDLLLRAKGLCDHGSWLPWLSAHCPHITPRTAQNYMRLASEWDRLLTLANAKRVSHLGVRQAVVLLSGTVADPPADRPETPRQRIERVLGGLTDAELTRLADRAERAEPDVGPDYVWAGRRRYATPFHKLHLDAGTDLDIRGEEWRFFVRSIRRHGQRQPVFIDEHDNVIDGRQRLRACAELGLTPKVEVKAGLSYEEAEDIFCACNFCRKSYTPRQRADVLRQLLALAGDGLSGSERAEYAEQLAYHEERAATFVGEDEEQALDDDAPADL